jgi:Na+/H+ antiporter NhaC
LSNTLAIRGVAGVVVFAAVCAAAALAAPVLGGEGGHWYSVVPPLLAVTLALVTRRLLPSLGAAVVVGGLLATVPARPTSASAWGEGLGSAALFFWGSITDPVNLQIMAFVVLVLTLVAVIIVAGGIHAVIGVLARFARGPRSTQVITTLMGLAIFIDDYANTMIVGSAMRPLTDRHRISREKLAFLVDATSAPIAGLAIVSTWIGYEVGLFAKTAESLGLGRDGYSMFFDALPFRFYCLLAIVFVVMNAVSGRDFGPMARAERRAREQGKLAADDARPLTSAGHATVGPDERARPRLMTAVLPVVVLFAVLLVGLWVDGGGLARPTLEILSPGAWRVVIAAAENNILILALAALISLLLACGLALAWGRLPLSTLGRTLLGGVRTSALPLLILVLAWSLKAACDALDTGGFLASVVSGVMAPLWFPAVLFLVAGVTAFATGTSWGTMAILIPTAIPVALALDGGSYGLITMMSLGAVLDGAIFGDHCSPISDTTLMSSISSACDHLHHVRTQLPYALVIAACALGLGYLPAAAGLPPWAGLLLGGAALGAVLWGLGRRVPADVGTGVSQASRSL